MDATQKTVYLGIKGDAVVHHTDLDAMREMDGIEKPDLVITEEEFERAGGLARLIKGKIFLGKTDAEKSADETAETVRQYRQNLADTDYVTYKLAEVSDDAKAYAAMKAEYAEILENRAKWREFVSENS